MEVGAPMHQQNRFFDFGTDLLPISLSPGQTEYVSIMFLPCDDGIVSVSRNTSLAVSKPPSLIINRLVSNSYSFI